MSGFRQLISLFNNQPALPNGLILIGSYGTFNSDISRFLIQSWLCNDKDSPCLTCSTCTSITNNTHPDFIHITEESIGIDQIRQLQITTQYGPNQLQDLIILFSRQSILTPEASNAFLKFIESPPPGVHVIFQVHQLHDLIPTIRSRCHHLYLPIITQEDLSTMNLNHHLTDPYLSEFSLINEPVSNMIISFYKLLQLSLTERLRLSEQFASSISLIKFQLNHWLRELIAQNRFSSHMSIILNTLSQLTNTTNNKLQLDAFMVSL